jgi:hypothetical protein
MPLVVLRGGSRDGESTDLDEHVERLLAASVAPGLIDVYEATDELQHVEGNDDDGVVYQFVGQEPLTEHEGTQLHMPHSSGYA